MLIGRQAEQAAVEALLARARAGEGGALVVRGEAGIGKTALLQHAITGADGFTVLRAIGVESVAMLFASRDGEHRRLEAPGVAELRIAGLDAVASEQLLAREHPQMDTT